MKHVPMAILGLTAAAVVTGGLSSAPAKHASEATDATETAPATSFGHSCQSLDLVDAAVASQYTRPTVCLVRDADGKRFYLFSGVLRFVAGQPVQAQFTVTKGLALTGATIVPVAGYQGGNPSATYYGYAVIEPDGQIKIEGTRNGQAYTVAISGQIPVGIPSGEPSGQPAAQR